MDSTRKFNLHNTKQIRHRPAVPGHVRVNPDLSCTCLKRRWSNRKCHSHTAVWVTHQKCRSHRKYGSHTGSVSHTVQCRSHTALSVTHRMCGSHTGSVGHAPEVSEEERARVVDEVVAVALGVQQHTARVQQLQVLQHTGNRSQWDRSVYNHGNCAQHRVPYRLVYKTHFFAPKLNIKSGGASYT